MKSSLVDEVRQLLLNMPDTLSFDTLERRKAAIVRISEHAKKHPLYNKSEPARASFYAPLRNVSVEKAVQMSWVHFLDRMSNAPTPAHMEGAIVVCFPIIGDLLRGRGR